MFTPDLNVYFLTSGKSSTIWLVSFQISIIIPSELSFVCTSSANLKILCVPNTISINLYFVLIFSISSGSCIIQPHIAISISGLFFLTTFILPRCPYNLLLAFSLTEQVLYITKSASSLSVWTKPAASNIPASFSESLAFIWHPKVWM